jgi:TonB family protein
MRTRNLIAFATFAIFLSSFAVAQSTAPAADSSSVSPTTPAANVDDAAFNSYLRVTKGMKPPKATKSPDPDYPKVPADVEPNGIVVMLIGINEKGRVDLVHVLRASNEAFQESAVSTVKTWKFSPAKKDGKPVPVQVTVEMKFEK